MTPERRREILTRLYNAKVARDDLLAYVRLTMPDPKDASANPRTRYLTGRHHELMARKLQDLEAGRIRRVILNLGPRHGKACADDTPVLTPTGWTTHAELRPGSTVFGPDGTPARVLATRRWEPDMLRVHFSNGDSVCVHRNHEWTVRDDKRGARSVTLETHELAAEVWCRKPSGKRFTRWKLPDTAPVQHPTALLPIHPYALGAWLGDGAASSPRFVGVDEEIFDAVAACGYPVSARGRHRTQGTPWVNFGSGRPNVRSEFSQGLKDLGLLGNKHIPDLYLRASVEQRMQLLAGLIDTDGHCDPRGRIRIVTADPTLADGIFDLCAGLALRPYRTEQAPHTSTSGVTGRRRAITIGFQATGPIPCRVPRKRPVRFAPRRAVAITAITPDTASGCQSIQVDRPDGLYLVGKTLLPTHNTELASKKFVAWFSGRHPEKSLILGTYNEIYAGDIGRAVRDNILASEHRLVFPEHELKEGSVAAQRLETTFGGQLSFVGRGGSITGRGGHGLIIDDPIKDRREADSQLTRDQLWDWFNQVIGTRMMTHDAWIMLIQTRWHEDDLVGRLTDPQNPFYNAEEAKHWHVIDLPAIALENDPLNRKPGEALWPERFPIPFLEEQKRRDPRGFQALYQGRPTAADGNFFHAEWLNTYRQNELPENLQRYCASDHAVSTLQNRDKTVLMSAGVAENGDIYVLPSLFWRQASSDVVAEAMLNMMREHKPLFWWAERGHISKAIGPFLRKRMHEEGVYAPIIELTPVADKQTRAQSVQGRMAMGKVFFPSFAPWWPEARDQLLKFPNGAHDDFVDALAYIGLGLTTMVAPSGGRTEMDVGRPGTFRNMFYRIRRTDAQQRIRNARAGW